MKRYIYLVFIGLATFIFASCEGPAGPPGADGINGTDGADGSVTCLVCHEGTVMEAIESEFYTSQHALGDIAVDYAGGRGTCAECHSHQGYVEWANTGTVAEDFSAPEAWQCGTCHALHKTFEATDYAFRAGDPVTLEDGTEVDGGNNNTCINCHKARRGDSDYDSETTAQTYTEDFDGDDFAAYANAAVGPAGSNTDNGDGTRTIVFDVPTTHVYISSTHAGPHHGPQGNVWAGVGAAGDVVESAFAAHDGGCVECHMGPESGHSFKAEEGNCNVAGCHSAVPEAAMDAIAARLEAIAVALDALHAIHIDDTWSSGDPLFGAVHPMLASVTRAEFQAFWNFMIVMEDRSMSAHNPTYVKALLTQCETALGL
jgi:hypothetical protein